MKPLIDLHTHTIASAHAYSSVTENIQRAQELGLGILGMSDHAPSLPNSTCPAFFANLKVLPRHMGQLTFLKGVEANILSSKGDIDMSKDLLDGLDYAIASIHMPCYIQKSMEGNTEAYLKAMTIDKVVMIGHPDDSRFPVNYDALVQGAKAQGVLLEVNNSSISENSFRLGARENIMEMLTLCKKYEVEVMMSSDAHYHLDVGNFDRVLSLMAELDFPIGLVANYNIDDFLNRLK